MMFVTQAIKDAKEREMLLEDKEIQLFADAKKVQTCMQLACANVIQLFLENVETP